MKIARRMFYKSISVLLLVAACQAQQPSIQKVDPPNWFIGLPNPMLLIKGEHLQSANANTTFSGVRVSHLQGQLTATSANGGDYLFVWLEIAADAKPGSAPITISTPSGSTTLNFPITKRRPLSDGFRGFDANDVIYLIMPDRFADGDPSNNAPPQSPNSYDRNSARAYHGGDLRGITQHLDYLKDLGVTTIWITPIYHNADDRRDYHGYGAVDLYAVDERLGTLEDYQRLVAAAHQRGMKVLLDLVPNHIGPTHPWVNDPPDIEWLHGTKRNHLRAEGNFAPITDPHSEYPEWRAVVEGWFADILPDLNTENPLTKQYLIQNGIWWAEEAALDGFRLDTFPYVGRQFWHDFHSTMHSAYPDFKTVGECFNGDATIVSYFAGGVARDGVDTGLDTPFDFPVTFAIRGALTGDLPISKLADTLRLDRLYPHPERLVPFEGNHDISRFMTDAKGDTRKLKLAFSILLTIRGTPQMYYGDEIGMEGNGDPDNRRDFPGGFPGDTRNAFLESERTPQEQEIFHYVQSLLRIRSEHPALRGGDLKDIYVDDTAYVYERRRGRDAVLISINNSDQTRAIKLPSFFTGRLVPLSEGTPNPQTKSTGIEIEQSARTAEIYSIH